MASVESPCPTSRAVTASLEFTLFLSASTDIILCHPCQKGEQFQFGSDLSSTHFDIGLVVICERQLLYLWME